MNYGSVFYRFIATVLDGIIVFSLSMFLNRFIFIGWVLSFFLYFFYYPFFWSSSARATPGKYLMGLSVSDMNGDRITLKQAMIRWICSFVSGLFLCLGYIFAFFNEKRQTFHDLMAGTVVIDKKFEPEEGLFNSWIDQIKTLTK
jgi:uncharacterized RDD family membrane protein YckC